ncbi:MAG: hypothetical protein QM754_20810 [Tepidisphaeraceae bacterium]
MRELDRDASGGQKAAQLSAMADCEVDEIRPPAIAKVSRISISLERKS